MGYKSEMKKLIVKWFFQLQMLFNSTLYAPILLFFVRKAYYIWDRKKTVLYAGYTLVGASFVMAIIA